MAEFGYADPLRDPGFGRPAQDPLGAYYNSSPQSPADGDAALEYYMSYDAYAPFDLTPDGRRMGGCIDPRPDDVPGQPQLTKLQGPGSDAGESSDHALAATVVENRFVTLQEANRQDRAYRRASVQGAHRSICAYVESYLPIMAEQADPAAATTEAVHRWIAANELGEVVTDYVLFAVQDAAREHAEHMQRAAPREIHQVVEAIDQAFPGYHNVPQMRGEATPGFYIVNGYPHLGLNRHMTHDVRRVPQQAYHDSLLARIDDIYNTHALPFEVRRHRLGALLLRSAATRTVINRVKRDAGHPLVNIEVAIGDRGPVFRRVAVED